MKTPWDPEPYVVKEVKGSQLVVERGGRKLKRAKNFIKKLEPRPEYLQTQVKYQRGERYEEEAEVSDCYMARTARDCDEGFRGQEAEIIQEVQEAEFVERQEAEVIQKAQEVEVAQEEIQDAVEVQEEQEAEEAQELQDFQELQEFEEVQEEGDSHQEEEDRESVQRSRKQPSPAQRRKRKAG